MFLHQKFDWSYVHIDSQEKFNAMVERFNTSQPSITGLDTETDGLHHMVAKPFLLAFGWLGYVYTIDMNDNMGLIESILNIIGKNSILFAHNAKFDYHMMLQYGIEESLLESLRWADSITVARLTNYADAELSMSLESLGQSFVDSNAKFGGKVIKATMVEMDRASRKFAKQTELEFVPANYLDVYKAKPNLMLNYAADDIVIMLKYVEKALPILDEVDPNRLVFTRESKLIPVVARMERIGFLVDQEYALQAREKFVEYRDKLYNTLKELTGKEFSVGQHELIKTIFRDKFGIVLFSSDEKNLKKIVLTSQNKDAVEVARTIIELRTVDKWISTYIDGKLSSLVNGRAYTSINNSGAVSGRVSSDMQQQPKEGFVDRDGNELFHPRRMFVADEGYSFFFLDYSQMELRVQAYYTMLVMGGDVNLCRAYIPFNCESILTGEDFDYKSKEVLSRWDSGEWIKKEDGQPWEPTDLHDVTTFKAFPFLNGDKKHPEFKHYRKLGKMANFLKNYQGGIDRLQESLDTTREIAEALHYAYIESFPGVAEYQRWVRAQYQKYRYVENLYGRRYYMQDLKWAYKGANYLIQGGCADMMKFKEIELDELLKGTGVDLVLPIHDEIIIRVPKGKEKYVELVHKSIQDIKTVPFIPMISEIEMTTKSWADKEEYTYE